MNQEHPLDLTALRTPADADRWDRLVAAALVRVDPILDRRRAAGSPFAVIAAWSRPILAAAALTALLFSSYALLTRPPEGEPAYTAAAALAAFSRSTLQGVHTPDAATLLHAASLAAPREQVR